MKKRLLHSLLLICLAHTSCREPNANPSIALINEMNLKRGDLISCGPAGGRFGALAFETSCNGKEKEDFNLAVKLLHSFEYDEAEKVFARIIDDNPGCAMAYWGVAMSNYHPLWTPPTEGELKKGARAIRLAQSIAGKTEREEAYINALAAFYQDWEKTDHRSRSQAFEKRMEQLYLAYPRDREAAIFYALALNAAADPSDKTYRNQKKAGAILNELYPEGPDHPGIIHYLIHTYDAPELAQQALPAARRYAQVAPSSAHALHMPSHIFTRLGLWDECIQSNLASIATAQCYASSAGIRGHWDEELHGMDYLVYAYLQQGQNKLAKQQWEHLDAMEEVHPLNFKVAYAFASIPSRFLLENRKWKEAAALRPRDNFPWQDHPWPKAMLHFTRLMGAVHTGALPAAQAELEELKRINRQLLGQKDAYKAGQVQIQATTGEAWIRFRGGQTEEALRLMQQAADLEDRTEKHPVTPGEVIPARELLGDLYLQAAQPEKALEAYEQNLKKRPGRFNALYGAGLAAERSGQGGKAAAYYRQLDSLAGSRSERPELAAIRQYLARR